MMKLRQILVQFFFFMWSDFLNSGGTIVVDLNAIKGITKLKWIFCVGCFK